MAQSQLRFRPLKEVYNLVQLRSKYRQTRLQIAKNHNTVFIRCEPNQKHCKIQGALCLNVVAPINYEMGYLIGTIRDRLIKNNASIDEQTSFYLFMNQKIMTSFSQKIGKYWKQNKQDDDILYMQYSDQAPF